MTISYFYCAFCNYKSKRNYDLKRHQNAVHKDLILNINNQKNNIQNDFNTIQNQNKNIQNEKEKNYRCKKCNKEYKTKKNYIEHENKCIGIDSLTCPKCMHHFSSSGNKSKHMKKNNCKPKSIIHALNNNITTNITNNIINNITNNITNNFIINNFEKERLDYIGIKNILELFKNSEDCYVPKYIKLKHYNKEFPENHNIKYNKNTGCLVKNNDKWVFKDINDFSEILLLNNTKYLHEYYKNNINDFNEIIKDIKTYNLIHSKLNYLDLDISSAKFKILKNQIIKIIKENIYI